MTTAVILDATRFADGIMLHLDRIPEEGFQCVRIGDTIYSAILCPDVGARITISSSYPADYFRRNNIAEFIS